MLNFILKDEYTILYKDIEEIKLKRDKDGVLNLNTPKNNEAIERDIKEYFLNNPFARLLANLSMKEVSIATIITMYHFLVNVKKDYEILKAQFLNPMNKDYNALLAIRQKNSLKSDKEHMKLLWYTGKIETKEEAMAVIDFNFKEWKEGFDYIAIPLNGYEDFMNEINK